MSLIVVDIEADGEYPSDYSMVCFGACIVEPRLSKTFYGETPPVSKLYNPEALAISGFTRGQHEAFSKPIEDTMREFALWIEQNSTGRPVFISDNLAFDWMWTNYYLHKYAGRNPFGFSGRRITDLWCGFQNDMGSKWKWMRKTKHTHNPVDDAKGNAEALLEMKRRGLNLRF